MSILSNTHLISNNSFKLWEDIFYDVSVNISWKNQLWTAFLVKLFTTLRLWSTRLPNDMTNCNYIVQFSNNVYLVITLQYVIINLLTLHSIISKINTNKRQNDKTPMLWLISTVRRCQFSKPNIRCVRCVPIILPGIYQFLAIDFTGCSSNVLILGSLDGSNQKNHHHGL